MAPSSSSSSSSSSSMTATMATSDRNRASGAARVISSSRTTSAAVIPTTTTLLLLLASTAGTLFAPFASAAGTACISLKSSKHCAAFGDAYISTAVVIAGKQFSTVDEFDSAFDNYYSSGGFVKEQLNYFQCSGWDGTTNQPRYSVSYYCANFLGRAESLQCAKDGNGGTAALNAAAIGTLAKPLCKATCDKYAAGWNSALLTGTKYCPNFTQSQQKYIEMQGVCSSAPYNGAAGNCVDGNVNEAATCGLINPSKDQLCGICKANGSDPCCSNADVAKQCNLKPSDSNKDTNKDATATPSPDSPAHDSNTSKTKLSTGAIIGIAVGSAAALLLLILLFILWRKRSAAKLMSRSKAGTGLSPLYADEKGSPGISGSPSSAALLFATQSVSAGGSGGGGGGNVVGMPRNSDSHSAEDVAMTRTRMIRSSNPMFASNTSGHMSDGTASPGIATGPVNSTANLLQHHASAASMRAAAAAASALPIAAAASTATAGNTDYATALGSNSPHVGTNEYVSAAAVAAAGVAAFSTGAASGSAGSGASVGAGSGGSDQEDVCPFRARVVYNYDKNMDDELELRVNEVMLVLKMFDDGWALARDLSTGREGAIPLACVTYDTLTSTATNTTNGSVSAASRLSQLHQGPLDYTDSEAGGRVGTESSYDGTGSQSGSNLPRRTSSRHEHRRPDRMFDNHPMPNPTGF
ncbi:hypothetical protein GQ42DRAFT_151882 [Ramicandelaber brevisporus]|nr:hypothetical protein GQ42DRAFT_151882 [Ramicandelaber brevisporus]